MTKKYIKPNTKDIHIIEKEMMMAGSSPGIHNQQGNGQQLGKGYNTDEDAFEEADNSSIWDD